MKRCPKCGNCMDDNQKHCLVCDYQEKINKKQICPECGEILTKGVCYRCGYRKKGSHNTCPYCRQKLVAGRCERCDYTKPFAYTGYRLKWRLIAIIIALISIIFLKFYLNGDIL